MAQGKKRMTIQGLVPGEEYVIQVRAVDEGEPSVWSEKYPVETIDDTAGGTRTPVTPTLATWTLSGEGVFTATWPTVNANSDGTAMVVDHYELQLTASGGAVRLLPHYGVASGTQSRDFSMAQIKAMFGGLPSSVAATLRVYNSGGTPSDWSNSLSIDLPVPYMPTEVTPEVESVIDGVKAMWGPPAEPYVPGDPRWPAGYRVYFSIGDQNFVPDVAQKSNLLYQGPSLEAVMTSLSYETDHWFKVASYSVADLQSDYIEVGPVRPKSPYGPDTEPPLIPTITGLTLNSDRSVSGQANITWSISEAAPENEDLAGFVVAWKLTSDTQWRNTYFEKTARAGVIDLPRAFGNYDFKIAAYDFVGNYSDFSVPQSLEGAGDPPAALTGVDGIPRWDGIRLVWDHSTSQAVLNGGLYQIQFKSTNSFTDNVPTYTTANNFLDIAGLTPAQSTWYWRVRAVDVIGRTSSWSAVQTETLPAFPSGSNKDGVAPQTAPANPRTAGGINYINVSWDRVTNNDATNYELYGSDTSGFTIGPGNLIAVTPATSVMVNNIPGAPNGGVMAQNTTYYFKVRAVDLDGVGPTSAQTSGQLVQIAAGDLGINMSGENLLYNTSFEEDADANGVATYWEVVNGNPGATPVTPTMPTVGRTGGKAQRISWTGNTSGITKGIRPTANNVVVRPFTEYTLSFYARAGTGTYPGSAAGTGFQLNFGTAPATGPTTIANPTPSATDWNRYIYKFTTGASVDPNNFSISITGHSGSDGWIEFDDIQLEAGNIASAYKTGTVSVAKLATGTIESAIITIATGGQIKSADYNLTNKTGFLITGTGINLLGGIVNAAVLQADSTISNKLFVGNVLEVATGGFIRSSNYSAVGAGAGYQISQNSLDIRSGTVAAGTLSAGTIVSPDIVVGAGGKITVDATGAIQSNNYVNGTTGWKIASTGIEMWDTNSKISVAALETGTLSSAVVTIGSGGEFKSANWNATTKTGYRLAETGFTLYNGTIEGSTIKTNQIYSLTNDATSGKPTFSINAQGYAELAGALVHGNMRVSDGASNVIRSYNYNGNGAGWEIRGDGWATFFQVQTWNLNVYNSAKVGADASHSISSHNFAYGASGWIIRGDGYAEFNAGRLVVGDWSGGSSQLLNDAWGNGQLRFYSPGRTDAFHHIRANGTMFEMRGGWGGAIEMYPNGGGGSLVRIINNLEVTSGADIGAATVIRGELRVMNRPGGGNRYVLFNNDGWLRDGGSTSSRELKKDIGPLEATVENILALEPYSFRYKTDEDGTKKSVGFIAEDADELGLSHWVDYDEEGKPAAFDYPFFVAALQMVNRAQQEEINDLRTRLEGLERRS